MDRDLSVDHLWLRKLPVKISLLKPCVRIREWPYLFSLHLPKLKRKHLQRSFLQTTQLHTGFQRPKFPIIFRFHSILILIFDSTEYSTPSRTTSLLPILLTTPHFIKLFTLITVFIFSSHVVGKFY